MKKEEIIAKYGEAAYEKILEQSRAWNKAHPEERKANKRRCREAHPEQDKAAAKARSKKYNEVHKEEVLARTKKWQEAHRNGFIDVILLLDGEITSHGRIKGCEQ